MRNPIGRTACIILNSSMPTTTQQHNKKIKYNVTLAPYVIFKTMSRILMSPLDLAFEMRISNKQPLVYTLRQIFTSSLGNSSLRCLF